MTLTAVAASYDVAVIGAGPAGSAAAIELARHGQRVLVLERSHYDDVRIGETLPPQAGPWLRRLGIEGAFSSVSSLPATRVVRLWERPALVADPMTFENERSGWHIDRPRFDALLAEVAERAGAAVHRGALAASYHQRSDGGWEVHFDWHGRRAVAEARWLIDATGRRSWFLRRQGLRVRPLDRLVGLLGYGGARTSADNALCVEATGTGWWYSAPLPGQRSVAAFMTDSDLLPRDRGSLASLWEEQRRGSELISRLHGPATSVRTVVARTTWSGTVAASRWLAVGDAALAFDPLFGFGICHALASGWSSARAVMEASAQRTEAIERYQAWSESRYRDYLALRRRSYGSVTRWPGSPFWQRRAS